ncbi:hypothetical protein BC829DRAFT_31044 [Chytridium lagenaria]|nr:hypothetical protein BC829DRAFT_31044 [Chytridium lagenaria]
MRAVTDIGIWPLEWRRIYGWTLQVFCIYRTDKSSQILKRTHETDVGEPVSSWTISINDIRSPPFLQLLPSSSRGYKFLQIYSAKRHWQGVHDVLPYHLERSQPCIKECVSLPLTTAEDLDNYRVRIRETEGRLTEWRYSLPPSFDVDLSGTSISVELNDNAPPDIDKIALPWIPRLQLSHLPLTSSRY